MLVNGNLAIAKAAISAGCSLYFGYPITPQNEIPEYMSENLPKAGGIFIQAESEPAAINMLYGASSAGKRAMTTSSSPGISLMQEGISFLAAAELPCVIVNVMRGGPGLGNVKASQSDYFQSTRGGGHGGYRTLVLAPASVQECFDITAKAFDLADKYRIPVIILSDAMTGRMIEPLNTKEIQPSEPGKEWSVGKGKRNLIKTLYLEEDTLEKTSIALEKKHEKIKQELTLYEEFMTDDAELVIVAYGIASRIAKESVMMARKENIKAGLLRPITLWPFPEKKVRELEKEILVVELSNGQLIEDAKLASGKEVHFLGRGGGWIPTPGDILDKIKSVIT